jgi:hypothetical protein
MPTTDVAIMVNLKDSIPHMILNMGCEHLLSKNELKTAIGLQITREVDENTTVHVKVPVDLGFITLSLVLKGKTWVRLA